MANKSERQQWNNWQANRLLAALTAAACVIAIVVAALVVIVGVVVVVITVSGADQWNLHSNAK